MKHIWSIMLTIVIATSALQAGSIWEKSKRNSRALHSDDTARAIGDTITVVIRERSVIENGTSRDMSKKSERAAKISGKMDLINAADDATGKLFNLRDLDLKMSGETKFNGDANFDSDRSMSDQITVTVQDVLANGNLVIMGTRRRQTHGETEIIDISGIVRPSDISFNNTIVSEKIADFHVVYRHKGQENDFTKPGWLDRALNYVSPY